MFLVKLDEIQKMFVVILMGLSAKQCFLISRMNIFINNDTQEIFKHTLLKDIISFVGHIRPKTPSITRCSKHFKDIYNLNIQAS